MKIRGPHPMLMVSLVATVLLSACGGPAPIDEAAETAAQVDSIHWFDGTVEEAFAVAAAEGRPIFLYWGAVWCPPCHYLKNKIFQRPEFVERSANFVMVYLDGDTDRAQVYGERFGTMGYPTVIVFGADGEERMRMPSTVDSELYGELMDQAMTMRPLGDVLASVRETGAATADPGDLQLLAYYEWGQDHLLDISDEELFGIFEALYRETPETLRLEKSRFLSLYLTRMIRLQRSEEEEIRALAELDAGQRTVLDGEVRRILTDPELKAANLAFLYYWSSETVELLHPEASAKRDSLIVEWRAAAAAAARDESLTIDDRLSALTPRLDLAILEAGDVEEGEGLEFSEELRAEVRERTSWALAEVDGPGDMQTVLNTSAHLLNDVGLPDEAETALLDHIGEARAPWYFMGWLGSLREDAGEPLQALEWYRKAYEAAEGRYTRFRWGSIYLRNLMDLVPEDAETIAVESERVLAELVTFEDAFAHGNYSRLRQLDRAYREWNEEGAHQEVVDAVRQQVHIACSGFPADGDDSQAERCAGFLADELEEAV